MKRLVLLLITGAWFVLSAPFPAWAQTIFTYHRDIGSSITFAWTHDKACPQVDAQNVPTPSVFDRFEFQGIKNGTTTDVRLQGSTSDTQVPILAAYEGEIYLQVREVCRRTNNSLIYSAYASSKDPALATVNGAAQGWIVSYDMKPPSEVIISKP